MPAGTLTLTNNSAVVKGAGTTFTTELKPGDFVVAVVGGVTYTLPVKTVDNATQATLIRAYDGPTQAGAAWSAVPRETLNAITAQLAAESSRALRGLNYDKDNWQQVFSGTGNVTVKLPDGSTFTGPAWNSFNAALEKKANATDVANSLEKKADKTSLGDSASKNVGTEKGTVAAGDDSRLNTINNKSGGRITTDVTLSKDLTVEGDSYIVKNKVLLNSDGAKNVNGMRFVATSDLRADSYHLEVVGSYHLYGLHVYGGGGHGWYEFRHNGMAFTNGSWNSSSDARLKTEITKISDALSRLEGLGGYTYLKEGNPEAGVIAQEVKVAVPQAVIESPLRTQSGEEIKDCLSVNINGVVALLIESVKELASEVDSIRTEVEKLKK